jgi:ABC-type multidrug transport system fused ATPase/permease subunit
MTSVTITQLLWEFAKSHPWISFSQICLCFLIPAQSIVMPHIYGNVISAIENNKPLLPPFTLVSFVIVGLFIMFAVQDALDTIFTPALQAFFRNKVFAIVLQHYQQRFDQIKIGEIVSRVSRLPITVTDFVNDVLTYWFPSILTILLAGLYFSYYDCYLGIALLLVGAIYVGCILVASKTCNSTSSSRDATYFNITEEMEDVFRNMVSVYSHDKTDFEIKRILPFTTAYKKLYKKTMDCGSFMKLSTIPLTILFLAMFLYRSYTLYQTKRLSTASFVSLFLIVMWLLDLMIYLSNQGTRLIFELGGIEGAMALVNDVSTTLECTEQYSDIPHVERKVPSNSVLSFVGVSLSYKDKKVLDEISFNIGQSESVAVIGRIGTGKTTILKLIMKFLCPSSGVILFNGKSYKHLSKSVLRKQIGYIPQQPVLFNRSLYENIVYGMPQISKNVVGSLLQRHGVHDILGNFDLDKKVGKGGNLLSGGQRQIVIILRTILQNPDVMLLDEPTSAIDSDTKRAVMKLLQEAMRNKTVVMVTHDHELLKYATRVVTLQNGKFA